MHGERSPLSVDERYSLGLRALLDHGSLQAMSRETGLSMTALQRLRDDFLDAARAGLTHSGGASTDDRAALAGEAFALAGALADAGENARANACFDRACAWSPDAGLYRKGHALFLLGWGRPTAARRRAVEAAALMGPDPELDTVIATGAWHEGRDDEARSHLERALAVADAPGHLLGFLVDLAVATGTLDQAVDFAERAMAAHESGDARPAARVLAQVRRRAGDFDEAESILRAAIERWPDALEFPIMLARFECDVRGRPQAGIERLHDLVERYPANRAVRMALADAMRASGRWFDAERAYLQVLFLDPRSTAGHAGLLEVYRATGQLERARAVAHTVLREQPGHIGVRLLLMEMLMDAADIAGLESELAFWRVAAPDSPDLAALALFLAVESGEAQAADDAEARLIERLAGPATLGDRVGAVLIVCRYLRQKGRASLAIVDALPRRDRELTPARIERSMALIAAGRTDDARALLEEIWRREPAQGLHGARLARHIFEQHGDRAGALEVLEQTRRRAGWSDPFALGLATALASIGQRGEALQVVHDYFIAEGRPVPVMSYLHREIGAPEDWADESAGRRLAGHAVHIAGRPGAEAEAEHLAAMQALADDPEAQRAVAAVRAALSRPSGDGDS